MLLHKSVYEIENTFSRSEILEWSEYLSDNPPWWMVSEMQNALIANGIYAYGGAKTKLSDFYITIEKESKNNTIHDLSVEEINKIAGVA